MNAISANIGKKGERNVKEDREATRQYLMEATYECETQPRQNMFDSDFVHCETVLEALCQSRHCFGDEQDRELLRGRLDYLLEHVKTSDNVMKLLGGDPSFPPQPKKVIVFPALVKVIENMELNDVRRILEKAKQLNSPEHPFSDMLNIRTRIYNGMDGSLVPFEHYCGYEFWSAGIFSFESGTVLHALVGTAYQHDQEELKALISDIVDAGGNPGLKNVQGLTPYGFACVEGVNFLIENFRLFGTELPVEEFAVPDREGRWLLTRVMDKVKEALSDPDDGDDDDRRVASLSSVLDVYSQVRPHLPQMAQDENRLVLSDTLSRVVRYGHPELVRMLIESGADPRYAAPGRAPAWIETVANHPWVQRSRTIHGFKDNSMVETVLFTGPRTGESPSLGASLSGHEMDWLRFYAPNMPERIASAIKQAQNMRGVEVEDGEIEDITR